LPEIIELDADGKVVETLALGVVLNKLAIEAVNWYLARAEHPTLCQREVDQWRNQTRRVLAGMAPGRERANLEAALTAVANTTWPDRHFGSLPPSGTQADADFRCSLILWALDQLRLTWFAEAERTAHVKLPPISPVEWWRRVFGAPIFDLVPNLPFREYD